MLAQGDSRVRRFVVSESVAGVRREVVLRYATQAGGSIVVTAEADGEDLGRWEGWEPDGREALVLVPWVRRVFGQR